MAMKHTIEQFLEDYNTLTPTNLQVGSAVAQSDWWSGLQTQFDDLLWMYYGNRVIFMNDRFNPENDDAAYANIIRSFVIWLKEHKRQLDRLYVGYMSDFNPLWNVDGVTGTISEDKHTGTDTARKTGSDTNKSSGTDTTRLSGSDSVAQSGTNVDQLSGTDSIEYNILKDDTTRTGSQTNSSDGTDTNSHGVFTFDDTSSAKPSAIDSTEYGKIDTIAFNSVKDAHELASENETTYGKRDEMTFGKTDTTTYGKQDATTYGKQDQTTYNNTLTDTKNLKDEHIDMVIRQGNIGVTRSDELLTHSAEYYQNDDLSNFYKYVVRSCVNMVSYAVEGV